LSVLRILIADDHEVARKGIRSLLESHPDWEVCAEASDGREAVEYASRLKPDVLLLDIGMPNLNGLDASLSTSASTDSSTGLRLCFAFLSVARLPAFLALPQAFCNFPSTCFNDHLIFIHEFSFLDFSLYFKAAMLASVLPCSALHELRVPGFGPGSGGLRSQSPPRPAGYE